MGRVAEDDKSTTNSMVRISSDWRATARRLDSAKRRGADVVDKEDALADGLLQTGKVSLTTQTIYRERATSLASKHGLTQELKSIDVDQALDRELLDLNLAGEEYNKPRTLFDAARWNWNLLNIDLPQSNAARLGF